MLRGEIKTVTKDEIYQPWSWSWGGGRPHNGGSRCSPSPHSQRPTLALCCPKSQRWSPGQNRLREEVWIDYEDWRFIPCCTQCLRRHSYSKSQHVDIGTFSSYCKQRTEPVCPVSTLWCCCSVWRKSFLKYFPQIVCTRCLLYVLVLSYMSNTCLSHILMVLSRSPETILVSSYCKRCHVITGYQFKCWEAFTLHFYWSFNDCSDKR